MTAVLATLLVFAFLVTLVTGLHRISRPYDGQQMWMPASLGVMGRSFAEHGIIATHGVPLQNNQLPGVQPDVYIHWPPLLPILLGEIFRVTGVSEAGARMLLLLALAGSVLGVYGIGAECCGPNAGMLAAFTWLTLPVVVVFSKESMQLNLAIPFLLAAIFCYIKATRQSPMRRGWIALTLICWCLAALSSWEPVLAAPGLLLLALFTRDRNQRRLALLSTIAVTATVAAVFTVFLTSYPAHAEQLWETVRYRLGFPFAFPAKMPFHAFIDQRWLRSHSQVDGLTKLLVLYGRFGELIGPVPLLLSVVGLMWLWVERKSHPAGRCLVAAVGALSPAVLWYGVMTNHVFYHNVEMLLWTPAVAITAAFGYTAIEQLSAQHQRYSALGVFVVAACGLAMLVPLLRDTKSRFLHPEQTSWIVAYGHDIDRATEPNAVVLTPEATMMTVYYCHRHLVRNVDGDAGLAEILPAMHGVFPNHPIYLAIPKKELNDFGSALRTYPTVDTEPSLVLLKIPSA